MFFQILVFLIKKLILDSFITFLNNLKPQMHLARKPTVTFRIFIFCNSKTFESENINPKWNKIIRIGKNSSQLEQNHPNRKISTPIGKIIIITGGFGD